MVRGGPAEIASPGSAERRAGSRGSAEGGRVHDGEPGQKTLQVQAQMALRSRLAPPMLALADRLAQGALSNSW